VGSEDGRRQKQTAAILQNRIAVSAALPLRAASRKRGYGNDGNDGAVESVESQKQASPSFHQPLGNLAQRRRDLESKLDFRIILRLENAGVGHGQHPSASQGGKARNILLRCTDKEHLAGLWSGRLLYANHRQAPAILHLIFGRLRRGLRARRRGPTRKQTQQHFRSQKQARRLPAISNAPYRLHVSDRYSLRRIKTSGPDRPHIRRGGALKGCARRSRIPIAAQSAKQIARRRWNRLAPKECMFLTRP